MLIMFLMSMKVRFILFAVLAIFALGCTANNADFEGMESSERSFNERKRKEAIAAMPLEAMFTNGQVRALARAAGEGNTSQIDELVKQGVDVNARGTHNVTPLFWALRNNNLKGFKKLLELDADPNVVFGEGSVMHWAAKHEDVAFLKAALQHGGDPNLEAGKLEKTPLFDTIGISGGANEQAMRVLLEAGADINAKTSGQIFGKPMGGKTPVMTAADLGRFDIVYELLERGADYKVKDDNGYDLADRVASMRDAFVPRSDSAKWLNKVIAWLSEHGVEVPENS
jgi:ankyrin repeat protein